MSDFIDFQFTRITTANTWTEVAGPNKGLPNFAGNDVAELDVLIQNFTATPAVIDVAITSTNTQPAANTESVSRRLNGLRTTGDTLQLQNILKGTEVLWVRSDRTDTHVTVTGSMEDN